MTMRRVALALALLGIAIACPAPSARAQEAPAEAEIPAADRLAELEQQILAARNRAAEWQARADEYERDRVQAPALLAALAAEIRQLEAGGGAPDLAGQDLEQLETSLIGVEQDLGLAREEAARLSSEIDRRASRRVALPELLADAKERLASLSPSAPAQGDDEAVAAARRRLTDQRRGALEAEVRSLQEELSSYDARGGLLEARRQRASLRADRAEERLDLLRQEILARRESEARREAELALETIEAAGSLEPVVREKVREIAQQNVELARSRTGEGGVLEAIESVSRKLTRADERVAGLEADLERLSHKVETGGLTDSLGLVLRKARSQAPDVGKYRRFIRMRKEQIALVQARQAELRDELDSISDVDAVVDRALRNLGEQVEDPVRIEAVLRDLVETKRKHLLTLLDDYERYFQRLVDFDARQQEMIRKTEELLTFIDERILWIPSGAALRPQVLADTAEALEWLATPRYWGQLARGFTTALADAPLSNLLVAFSFALWWPVGKRIRPRLRELAERARPSTCVHIAPTLEALGLSLAMVPWAPGLLMWVGWRLGASPDATQFVRSVAAGMFAAGVVWLTFELPRQLLRVHGVAADHFNWSDEARATLRRQLTALAAVAVPLVFLIEVFEARGEDAWRLSVGRAALIALLVFLTLTTHRLLRRGGPVRAILDAAPEIEMPLWAWKFLYAAGMAVPLMLTAVAARGYYYTAHQLGFTYHLSLVFVLVLFVLFELAVRWSLVARRRLAFAKIEEARRAEQEARRQNPELAGEAPVVVETELDLAAVDAQTARLLATVAWAALLLGLWVLWAELLPAVGFLDDVELWRTTETVTLESQTADGALQLQTEERVVPVSVADGLVALLVAFLTLVLVRNLPGLLEITVFRRFEVAPGERYAYSTITKYGIVLVGVVLAARAVGVGWSNVQWLVAAVGLGLGFGLQEIFANFVSGLIILFERPIRVGDTVTIGDINGTVSKIRIRATWITGFDRKELVVPNKEFVTQQLINWSLTDPVLRVEIPVGIAYGSDTERAMRELLRVADENEHVLRDPKPQVYFLGFGASSLDFELRVFSPDVDHRLLIHHQLHLAVDQAFREAGIEIAFPQRDLHVRSLPEAEVP